MQSHLVLTQDMMIVLGLTGFIIAMLMFDRIRADAASLVALAVLGLPVSSPKTNYSRVLPGMPSSVSWHR